MRQGLRGQLPESLEDFEQLKQQGKLRFKACMGGHAFAGRTHTPLGWAETQISGMCEECFDEITKDHDE